VEQVDERSSFACDRTRVRIAPGSPHFLLRNVWSVKDVRAALPGRDSAKDGAAVRANRARATIFSHSYAISPQPEMSLVPSGCRVVTAPGSGR
jgi:hypothetical protein